MHRTGPLIILTMIFAAAFSSCKKDESVNPQTPYYSVKGEVFSLKDTTEHLSNVIVSAGGLADTTDENGLFSLKQVPGGKVNFTFTYTDFKTFDTTITLSRDISLSIGLKRQRADIFPNEIGYYWKYVVFDSTYNPRTDTAVFSIIENGKFHDGRKGKIWQYDYWKYPGDKEPWGVFNGIVYENNLVEYVLPVFVGQKWEYGLRKTTVQAIENVETPAGTIPGCYKLYQTESLENHYGYRIYWFAPRIGMVKQIYKVYDLGGSNNSTWILAGYKLE